MKTFVTFLVTGLLSTFSLGSFTARADLEVGASVQIRARADFETPLAAHGSWVEVRPYGHCWRPVGVAVDWRPYCEGHWLWTDCGWYWVSDEPWAWACYHYGNWVYDAGFGWVWVPGIEWAPCWVSWRVGNGFIGWAPLPPPGFVTVGVAAPTLFVFVGTSHFSEPVHRSRVIVNNTKIINQTTVINNIRRENRTVSGGTAQQVVINQGPGIDPIQKATGKTVSAVPIGDAVRRTPVPTTLKPQPFSPTGQQTPTVNRPAIPDRNQVPAKTIQPPPANGSSRPQMVPPSDPRTRPPTPPANGQAPGRGHDQKPDQERGRGHDKDGG